MISITNAAKEPHITPLQDSMWHRGMAGIDSCVFNFFENFAAEVSSNNSVKIRSGIGMIQGRYFCVEPSTYDEVTIANGTQGEKRKDLIVCRWTVNEEQKVQSGDWVVIQGTPTTGTPVAPSYTAGDLDAGDLIADMPFYEVTLDGINVTGVTQKFTGLSGIGKFPNPLPISKGGTGKTTAAAAAKVLGVGDYCFIKISGDTGTWSTTGGKVETLSISSQQGAYFTDNKNSTFKVNKACKIKTSGTIQLSPAVSGTAVALEVDLRKGSTDVSCCKVMIDPTGGRSTEAFGTDIVTLAAGDVLSFFAKATSANKVRLGGQTRFLFEVTPV